MAQPLQPMSSNTNNTASPTTTPANKNLPLGATWTNSGNLNIDLDNLLGSKPKTAPTPSMNQLASNPTSPINHPRPVNQINNSAFNTNFGFNNVSSGYPQQQSNNQFLAGLKWSTMTLMWIKVIFKLKLRIKENFVNRFILENSDGFFELQTTIIKLHT